MAQGGNFSPACEGAMSALRAPPTRAQGAGGRPEAGICPWAALGAAGAAEGVPGGLWAALQGPMARGHAGRAHVAQVSRERVRRGLRAVGVETDHRAARDDGEVV